MMSINKTVIIAEAGVNHNGSFNQAKKLIEDDPDFKTMVKRIQKNYSNNSFIKETIKKKTGQTKLNF